MDFAKGGERFTATNMPLGGLLLIAYNITVRQLTGSDAVLSGKAFSEKYDIAAKAEHAVRPDVMLRMLQALLAERFKLVVRQETREVPVYALVLAKGGPAALSDSPASEAAGPLIPAHAGGIEPRSGQLVFKNESMRDFGWALSRAAGIGDRVVVDETGLTGGYDFELTFERDNGPAAGAEAGGPSIFSAVQEQLGLKLEAKKAPVEFVVIEHVENASQGGSSRAARHSWPPTNTG